MRASQFLVSAAGKRTGGSRLLSSRKGWSGRCCCSRGSWDPEGLSSSRVEGALQRPAKVMTKQLGLQDPQSAAQHAAPRGQCEGLSKEP